MQEKTIFQSNYTNQLETDILLSKHHSNFSNHLIKTKRIRRSKDFRTPRNYMCGCNKTYLSYAALYTHTKTKHNGVFPEGTINLNKKKQLKRVESDGSGSSEHAGVRGASAGGARLQCSEAPTETNGCTGRQPGPRTPSPRNKVSRHWSRTP